MSTQVQSRVGTFIWRENVSPERDRAIDFYSQLFGWEIDDMDVGGDTPYKIINAGGQFVMPGLWDNHQHFGNSQGAMDLANGVTCARDMANDTDSFLKRVERFDAGTEVTPELLQAHGLVARTGGVKVLARGDISKKLTIRAHKFSGKAAEKIAAAGGTAEVLA